MFAEKIRYLRAESGLSQAELAKKLKVSQTCITKLEKEQREPTGSTLIAYAKFFNVSIDYLVDLEDDYGVKHYTETNDLLKDEEELLSIYKNVPPEYKAQILEYARYSKQRTQDNDRLKNQTRR